MMLIDGSHIALLVALIIFLGLLFTALHVLSPGAPLPFRDPNGRVLAESISEKRFTVINGVKQGMFIRGKDRTLPVLLFLHGGPGMPEFAISQGYPAVLEDCFVVCWWEQRGSGLSFDPSIPTETLTEAQLICDALAVSDYLRTRFGQDKIYLMAHSAGTFFGIEAAARMPEIFHAYIGVAQISRQFVSEQLAYSYMLGHFEEAGNSGMVAKLRAFPLLTMTTMPAAYYAIRDKAMHSLGIGTTHAMRSVVRGIFMPVMLSRAYTPGEKFNFWRGKWSAASTNMWNDILATDLTLRVTSLEIPVYFLSGAHDYTVSRVLAKAYLETLRAPLKGFYTFEHSAHSPLFEEPERFGEILRRDVLAGSTSLADRIAPAVGQRKPC